VASIHSPIYSVTCRFQFGAGTECVLFRQEHKPMVMTTGYDHVMIIRSSRASCPDCSALSSHVHNYRRAPVKMAHTPDFTSCHQNSLHA
jgi:hypothetical protein